MNGRAAGGIAAAVVVVVGLPAIVAQATQQNQGQPTATQPPAPKAANLNIPISSEETQGANEAYLRIAAAGKAPARPSHLFSGSGSDSVRVNADDPSPCRRLPVHRALGQGANSEWCLRLRSITDGEQVSGKVTGKRTDLTLTVSRRTGFFVIPSLVVLAGLALGLVLLVVPRWLSNRIRKGMLDKQLDLNDEVPDDRKIVDLSDWVTTRRDAGQSDDALLPQVDWVRARGPAIAEKARQNLEQALKASSLPGSHPFRKAAEALVEKRPSLDVSDFLKEDGTRATRHPLMDWVEGLHKLESQKEELDRLRATTPEDQQAPMKALREAQQTFDAVSKPEEVDPVEAKLGAVRRAIGQLSPEEQVPHLMSNLLLQSAATIPSLPLVLKTTVALDVPQREPDRAERVRSVKRAPPDRLRSYQAGTAALIIVVVALGVLTIKQTLYEPIPDFGDFGDYFALITAAVGAGAGATVVGLLAPWNPRKEAES